MLLKQKNQKNVYVLGRRIKRANVFSLHSALCTHAFIFFFITPCKISFYRLSFLPVFCFIKLIRCSFEVCVRRGCNVHHCQKPNFTLNYLFFDTQTQNSHMNFEL